MILDIFITLFLVFLNGFFVAAEFAIVKVRVSKLALKARSGTRSAKLAMHITSHLDGYLSATQLGITLASLGLGWIGEEVVSKIILAIIHKIGFSLAPEVAHSIALPTSFVFITVMHIVFGELAPKSLAIQQAENTTLATAIPLNIFYQVFRPFIWVLNSFANFVLKSIGIRPVKEQEVHSPEELKLIVEQSIESGGLENTNYRILENVFDFTNRTARQVMVPRTRVFAIEKSRLLKDIAQEIFESGYSRIPVFEGTTDNIVGVIFVKDLFNTLRKNEDAKIDEILRDADFLPETMNIGKVLRYFQKHHLHMAVLVDEYGGTAGIVTMEDIIEELVGEIQDESDEEKPIVIRIDEDTCDADASAAIADVNDFLPDPIPESRDYDTLGGLMIYLFGRLPDVDDIYSYSGYEFKILERNKNRILRVQIKLTKEVEE